MSPLYLSEQDVEVSSARTMRSRQSRRPSSGLLAERSTIGCATRLPLDDGEFAVMACVDSELGYAGLKSYAWTATGTPFAVMLFSLVPARLAAVIEANALGALRTGAASGVAARYLAKAGASLTRRDRRRPAGGDSDRLHPGGAPDDRAGRCLLSRPRAARTLLCRQRLRSGRVASGGGTQDLLVTVTTANDPVVRGEWLVDGALVCAIGANDRSRRELDNAVLERAAFVCCDSREQSELESGDLIEPVERGVLDWLEVLRAPGCRQR